PTRRSAGTGRSPAASGGRGSSTSRRGRTRNWPRPRRGTSRTRKPRRTVPRPPTRGTNWRGSTRGTSTGGWSSGTGRASAGRSPLAVATGDDDLKPGERVKEIEKDHPELFDQTLEGHTGAVAGVAVAPDGKTLVSVGNDGPVRVWSAQTGALLKALAGPSTWV